MANDPGVRLRLNVNPFVPIDDAEHLAAEASLPVWLPSPWPPECGTPVFGVAGSDTPTSCWVARSADLQASPSLVIVGFRHDPRPQQPLSPSTIDGLGRESILRPRTSVRDGIQIVAHSLTIQFSEVKVVLNGRGLSADELTKIGDTLTRVGSANES